MNRKPIRPLRAFTLIEMLVVIGIIAILMAILLPMISTSKESGRIVYCANNLSQIGKALQMYVDEHKDYLPAANDNTTTWDSALLPYLNNSKAVFRCPSDPYIDSSVTNARTYAANGSAVDYGFGKYPFGQYAQNASPTVPPVRLGSLVNKTNSLVDLILIGEIGQRPILSPANRGVVGTYGFCGLDQVASTIHKKGVGGNYLLSSMGVRFLNSSAVELTTISSPTNFWTIP